METRLSKTNQVELKGIATSEYEYSHELFSEKFYIVNVEVERLSKIPDTIPVLVSERLVDVNQALLGKKLSIKGQFRSYNKAERERNRLLLSVFAKEITETEDIESNPNFIFLDGYVCKKPIYRMTPFGREITDILLAVNRAYNKSDYIPCICWGRNARFVQNFEIGDNVKIWGRIQSREYQKKVNENEYIARMAYEVSVTKLEKEKVDTDNI